jgi:hypothetical protein
LFLPDVTRKMSEVALQTLHDYAPTPTALAQGLDGSTVRLAAFQPSPSHVGWATGPAKQGDRIRKNVFQPSPSHVGWAAPPQSQYLHFSHLTTRSASGPVKTGCSQSRKHPRSQI